ncbi:MAG: hypothetical protein K2X47_00340 [Bdellovibrionales bacterium]|nr:hypothetical protein [Bdellovibrionales bacterium]
MVTEITKKCIFAALTAAALAPVVYQGASLADSKPEPSGAPFRCVERFSKRMAETVSYQTTISKREKGPSGSWKSDRIRLTDSDRGKSIEIVYLNEGSTGIKDNGMKVSYTAGQDLAIVYGESKGIGGIFGSLAKTAAPKTLKLTDSLSVNDEIFTINRAGFRFMSQLILKGIQTSEGKLEGTDAANNECVLKWTPASREYQQIQVSEGQDIWLLEEQYSTLASLIQRKNSDLFSKTSDVFRIRGTKKILVPKSFTGFTATIDLGLDLPKSFQLFWEGEMIGDYQFLETKILVKETR